MRGTSHPDITGASSHQRGPLLCALEKYRRSTLLAARTRARPPSVTYGLADVCHRLRRSFVRARRPPAFLKIPRKLPPGPGAVNGRPSRRDIYRFSLPLPFFHRALFSDVSMSARHLIVLYFFPHVRFPIGKLVKGIFGCQWGRFDSSARVPSDDITMTRYSFSVTVRIVLEKERIFAAFVGRD